MAYRGSTSYSHGQSPRIGVLIANLGSPKSPKPKDIRAFLGEFLSDPRVIELPKFLWQLILRGVILPFRPRKLQPLYEKIWHEHGSPLHVHMNDLTHSLQQYYQDTPIKIVMGMRYGEPSIQQALKELQDHHCHRIIVLPLYPQYSGTTTGSVFDALAKALQHTRLVPSIQFIHQYADHPAYIQAIAQSIQNFFSTHGKPDVLLYSFHGLPAKLLQQGDPYFCYCQKTARLISEFLELPSTQWSVSFQSRFGPTQWLRPYTVEHIQHLVNKGAKKIYIIAPGFSVDCLETLEEIQIQHKEVFEQAGGKVFHYIPALNASPLHKEFLTTLIEQALQGQLPIAPPAKLCQCKALGVSE